jgi:hypothetical protein
MAGQRDLARKRLEQLIEFGERWYPAPWEETAFALEQEGKDGSIWNDPRNRTCAAERAVSLPSAEADEPLRRAFEAFGLDPRNPFHWRRLAWYLSEALFGESGRGHPPTWTAEPLCRLLERFHNERKKNPGLTDESICQLVKNNFHREYSGIGAGTLRRKLQDARDLQRNAVLRGLYESFQAGMKREAEAEHGSPLSAEMLQRIEDQALQEAIEQIAAPHRNQRR